MENESIGSRTQKGGGGCFLAAFWTPGPQLGSCDTEGTQRKRGNYLLFERGKAKDAGNEKRGRKEESSGDWMVFTTIWKGKKQKSEHGT